MNELQTQIESLLEEVTSYNDKPNKAKSKRIRLQLGKLKNDTPIVRKELMDLDAAGYTA